MRLPVTTSDPLRGVRGPRRPPFSLLKFAKSDTLVSAGAKLFRARKAALDHVAAEPDPGSGPLVVALGPGLPGVPQILAGLPVLGGMHAALLDPPAEHVFAGEVFIGGGAHDLGGYETVFLPFLVAGERPAQDAGPLLAQLVGQLGVALLGRDRHGERDQVHTAPHRLVGGAEARLVVAGDHQLELRTKLEEVLAHEARRDPVAAGDRLYLRFSPA